MVRTDHKVIRRPKDPIARALDPGSSVKNSKAKVKLREAAAGVDCDEVLVVWRQGKGSVLFLVSKCQVYQLILTWG